MITFMALSAGADFDMIQVAVRKRAALYTEEKWDCLCFCTVTEAERFLEKEPVLELISWDVTLSGAQEALERLRKVHQEAFLLIVADTTVKPTVYLKPRIAPGALLLKPVEKANTEEVMQDIFDVFIQRWEEGISDTFLVETREGKQYIPIGQIDYFEAKEKKIFIRTKSSEYGFYGTLEMLQEKLPDGFLRCHRSYIVNMKRVKALLSKQNLLQMADSVVVPFSRSYKKILKEYWSNG
ncbi:MAG: LytTR family DNA-binding domain-containing protein [Lachnospiraceae bacterium]|nr:LytTR family DNA-binding domain-containing protein [Lachnospiraceae bacterium]